MMQHLKKLGGETLLYALMNVGTKLIAFLMLPIYTLYLSTTEMGVFENIEALVSMLTFLVIFGTDNALAYYFFKTEDENEKELYVRNVLSIRLYIALILFLLFIVLGPFISSLFLGSAKYSQLFMLAGLVLVIDAVITLILTYYRFQFKAKKVAGLTIFRLFLVALVSYAFLRFFNLRVESVYLARLLSGFLIIVILVFPVIKFLRFKIDRDIVKLILIYGAPLVPASIAFWVITFANRFFLTQFESLESAGIYGVAMKFAAMISLLTSSVQMAWRPYSLSIQKKDNAPQIFANFSLIILAIGMLGLTVVATAAPLFVDLMVSSGDYKVASQYVAALSLGSFLSFYYLIISVGLFIKEKTKVISKYVMISSGISIILNIVLIPFLSIWGAVIALVLSYLFVNFVIFKKSQEVYPIPFPMKKAMTVFIAGLLAIAGITYLYEINAGFSYFIVPWIVMLASLILLRPSKIELKQKSR
jgi:O-antigen/teichoic acid export membrane protein